MWIYGLYTEKRWKNDKRDLFQRKGSCFVKKHILDVYCGSRKFWFDKICTYLKASLYWQRKWKLIQCNYKQKYETLEEVPIVGIKKGTKLTDKPKDILYQIRVDKETDDKVKVICEKEGISKSEVIRQGINLIYKSLENVSRK